MNRFDGRKLFGASLCAALLMLSAPGAAQDATDVGPAVPQTRPVYEGLEAIKDALKGSWRAETSETNPETGETGGTIWMHISDIEVDGFNDTLYVERAWESHLHHPFAQTIFQVYRFKGEPRLRTLSFRRGSERADVLSGLWTVPDAMPLVRQSDLIATLDFEITSSEGGTYSGRTPHPYPTAEGGAVLMRSEFRVEGTTLRTMDTGIAADGSTAWHSNEGDGYTWRRAEADIRVDRADDGLIFIDYAGWDGREGSRGDVAFIDYVGQTGDNYVFWSAASAGTLARVMLPINVSPEGVNRALQGIREGMIRRVVVPPALGYGEQQAGQIPPNSTLYYLFECVRMEEGESKVDEGGDPGDQAGGAGDEGGAGGEEESGGGGGGA
jgi:hypothetical protein